MYLRGKNELVALRSIDEGEELTYDYSLTMWEEQERIKKLFHKELWHMNCSCNKKTCRKIIRQFYELPLPQQEKAITNQRVQDHIINQYQQSITTKTIPF